MSENRRVTRGGGHFAPPPWLLISGLADWYNSLMPNVEMERKFLHIINLLKNRGGGTFYPPPRNYHAMPLSVKFECIFELPTWYRGIANIEKIQICFQNSRDFRRGLR